MPLPSILCLPSNVSSSAIYNRIYINEINLKDTSYQLTPFPSTEPDKRLKDDIRSHGILHPPLLLEQGSHLYIVLSGRKRIEAVGNELDEAIPALILTTKQPLQIFSTLLRHRMIGSPLNPVEQAVFCQKALASLSMDELLPLLPVMGLKEKPHIPSQLIALLKLEESVLMGLHRGWISLRAAKNIALLPKPDQQVLCQWIKQLQLGGSKQQKLIDLVNELTQRLQINAETLLAQWQKKGQERQQLNGPQQGASLLNWLQEQYSPSLTTAEKQFREFCKELGLPPGVEVTHTLSFEDEEVRLSIDFGCKEKLKEKWEQIRPLLDDWSPLEK